jgi:CRP-like cAMP-binding protein
MPYINTQVKEVIPLCPAFKDWDAKLVNQLSKLAELRYVPAGEAILRPGDRVEFLYMIKKGIIEISKTTMKPDLRSVEVAGVRADGIITGRHADTFDKGRHICTHVMCSILHIHTYTGTYVDVRI